MQNSISSDVKQSSDGPLSTVVLNSRDPPGEEVRMALQNSFLIESSSHTPTTMLITQNELTANIES